MVAPPEIDDLPPAGLKQVIELLLAENAELKRTIIELREEIARLKGLKGRPQIKPGKPSGMDQGTGGTPREPRSGGRGRGKVTPRVTVEDQIIRTEVPPGSRLKGYEDFLMQDVVLRPRAIRYRRERWLTPDGRTVVAPLPGGVRGHFGPELHRFALATYHQGQMTVPWLVQRNRSHSPLSDRTTRNRKWANSDTYDRQGRVRHRGDVNAYGAAAARDRDQHLEAGAGAAAAR